MQWITKGIFPAFAGFCTCPPRPGCIVFLFDLPKCILDVHSALPEVLYEEFCMK